MRTYVYAEPRSGVCIAQGMWEWFDDIVVIRNAKAAVDVIAYITHRLSDPVWGGTGDEAMVVNGNGYLMMSKRDAEGNYGAGILIEQSTSIVVDDCILSDSPDRAKKLISAIRKRGKELGWEV